MTATAAILDTGSSNLRSVESEERTPGLTAAANDNVVGMEDRCQFHPEKSQRAGLRLLANFLELS